MAVNYDELFEKIVNILIPIWGPIYAVYYILRIMWKEIFNPEELG